MGFFDWLKRKLAPPPQISDQIPEVIGYITNEQGEKEPLHRGPLQHDRLSPDQLRRIGRLRDVLVDAYPMTLDGWIDGFMRDSNPESEIRIIEACASVYHRLCNGASLSPAEKKRIYSILCALSAGADGPELQAALPAGKGLPNIDSIAAMFREAWQAEERP